jgi:hypothetical protein
MAKRAPLVGTDYGPPPDWANYKALAEAAVRARLVDPDSAKFRWPMGYAKRGYTAFLSKRIYGYDTCGYVNSRNRMGGYVGETAFIVVIDRGQVLALDFGDSDGLGMVSELCAKTSFPSVESMVQAPAAPRLDYGFALTSVADGAYVSAVSPGSTAEKAGLKPRMVVAQLNGISLKGMAMTTIDQLLAATDGSVTLTIIGGNTVRVVKELVTAPAQPAPATEDAG